jgi:hypothetical protein
MARSKKSEVVSNVTTTNQENTNMTQTTQTTAQLIADALAGKLEEAQIAQVMSMLSGDRTGGGAVATVSGGGSGTHSLKLGNNYMVETVTKYFIGELVSITDCDLVLASAAWVADTGRYHEAVMNCKFPNNAEIEPYKDRVIVNRKSIVAVVPWDGALPRKAQ